MEMTNRDNLKWLYMQYCEYIRDLICAWDKVCLATTINWATRHHIQSTILGQVVEG